MSIGRNESLDLDDFDSRSMFVANKVTANKEVDERNCH